MSAAHSAGLRARGLTKTYGQGQGAVHALQGVDVDIDPGSLVVVTGRSGSGKTTLLNCLSGLDRPDSGQVFFAGLEVTALGDDALGDLRRDHIGFVFQTFGLLPMLTARENVGVPLRLRRSPVKFRESRVTELLELVGLLDHENHKPSQLSGGEQQRVALCRALVTSPQLLIADEPTGQLDSMTGRTIIDLIAAVTRELGCTTVIASHDERLISRADQHLQLLDGRLLVG